MSVTCTYQDNIALIAMDDGKANAVSPTLLEQLNQALDRANREASAVILSGRAGRFSAGFDLSVMGQGGAAMANLVVDGARLAYRLLQSPVPVVIACSGHALAMGGLLLMATDFRIGINGAYKIGLNEVAIGMTMPYFGVELARGRLHTPFFHRAVINAEMFSPAGAVDAGFLDQVVDESALAEAAFAAAQQLTKLNVSAHHLTKLRVREPMLRAVADAIEKEFGVKVG